jgi:hypothetical protein
MLGRSSSPTPLPFTRRHRYRSLVLRQLATQALVRSPQRYTGLVTSATASPYMVVTNERVKRVNGI